jgi:Fe-S-cluster containining protein
VPEQEFPPADCRSCGRCCFSELPEYVRVFGVDTDRMDERAMGFTGFIGNKLFMRMDGGRCTALAIDPNARTFSCSIYEMRPDVCRSLGRGTGACRADFETKRDRPDVAIEALLRR